MSDHENCCYDRHLRYGLTRWSYRQSDAVIRSSCLDWTSRVREDVVCSE